MMVDDIEPVRWGVLGTADIALTRTLPALHAATAATPLALASRGVAKAREAADRAGVPRAYGDYDALLADPEIEAVYIPLPNTLHFEWCVRALEASKHVLCEKPLTLSADETRRLIAARDASGCWIEEAFAYRSHPQWTDIGETLASGAIGAPRAAHAVLARRFMDPADIRNNPELGGGALYDLGSYAISAMGEVFGRAPLRVSAMFDIDPDYGVDQLTTAVLDYGDAQATFSVGIRAGSDAWGTHQQFSVLAERGWLACDFPFAHARPTACTLKIGDTTSVGSLPTEVKAYAPADHYLLQVERFSRVVRGEAVRRWPIEDALRTLTIIEALFDAGRTGGWITLAAD